MVQLQAQDRSDRAAGGKLVLATRICVFATIALTLLLLVLGQLVTTFRAGMADPVWPTEPWYLFNNYKFDFNYRIEHWHRIVGYSVGGFACILYLLVWCQAPTKGSRSLGIFGAGVLVGGYGAFFGDMMAQREAAHVNVPILPLVIMGLALTTLLGWCIKDLFTHSPQGGLRLLVTVLLLAVLIQGSLGGLRVRLHALLGSNLAVIHGIFAQFVFCLMVSAAVLTSRSPAMDISPADRQVLGRLSAALVGLLFVQLIWGALVRHIPTPLSQRLHLMTAFLAVATGAWLIRAGLSSPTARASVARVSSVLAILLAAQVILGIEAWMGKFTANTLPELETITVQKAVIRTAHVLVGTGVLATAVVLALRVRMRAAETETTTVDMAWTGRTPVRVMLAAANGLHSGDTP